MLIDYKYHIASLAAVFLALAIGILVGSTMIGSDFIANQQKEMIMKLEDDFSRLRAENSNLHVQIHLLDQRLGLETKFQQELFSVFLEGDLKNKPIALVQLQQKESTADWQKHLVEHIKKAEAKLVTNAVLVPEEVLRKREKIQEKFGFLGTEKEYLPWLSRKIGQELTGQVPLALLPYLKQLGVWRGKVSADLRPTSVILWNDEPKRRRLWNENLIDTWRNLQIIGIEASDAPFSSIAQYRQLGVASIDHIDTFAGQFTLLWLLQEKGKGSYGIKKTAEHLLPNIWR